MDVDLVRIGGRVYGQKSCAFSIAGVPYVGITAVKYGDGMDREHVYGMNKDGTPLALTPGKYTPDDLSITMLKDVFMNKFLLQMATLSTAFGAPGSYGAAVWPFIAQYAEGALPPSVDTLSDCSIVKVEDDIAEGSGALVTVITCKFMSLMRNGLTIYDRTRLP